MARRLPSGLPGGPGLWRGLRRCRPADRGGADLAAGAARVGQSLSAWQVALPLVGVWCYLLDGMFIGATRGAEMRNSMAVAAAGYGLTLFSVPLLGNHGLWLALAVFLSLRGLSLGWIWHRHRVRGSWFSAT